MTGALNVLVKELRELWDWPRPVIWIAASAVLLLAIVGNLRLNEPELRVLFVAASQAEGEVAHRALAEIANIDLIVAEPDDAGRERMMSDNVADIGVFWDDGWIVYERDRRSNKAGLIHAAAAEISASLQEQRPWQVSVIEHWQESGERPVWWFVGSGTAAESHARSLIPAYIAFVILFVPFVIASGAIVREEELGTLQTLLIAPGVNWFTFSLGKVAAPVIFSFALLNLLVIVSYAWFNLVLSGAWLHVLGVQLLAILSSTLLGFVAGTVIRSQQQANLAAAGYFLLLLLATGFLEPIEQAARSIQLFSWMFPLTWSYGYLADGMLSDADPERAMDLSYRLLGQIAAFSILATLGASAARRRI